MDLHGFIYSHAWVLFQGQPKGKAATPEWPQSNEQGAQPMFQNVPPSKKDFKKISQLVK